MMAPLVNAARLPPNLAVYSDADAIVENFRPLDNVTAGAQAAKHNIQTFNAAGERFRSAREAFDHQIQECAHAYIAA